MAASASITLSAVILADAASIGEHSTMRRIA